MKKLLNDILLPFAVVSVLIVLMAASFQAENIITNHRENYVAAVMNRTNNRDILIIDPGHGGTDGGAVSVTGHKESEINLSIALKTELIAGFLGINTVLTRSDEDIIYPENCDTIHDKKVYDTQSRVKLINSYPEAVLISIHQNNFTDDSAKGAQVFFGKHDNSANLADRITEKLTCFAETVRNSHKISDSIYIFNKISCKAVMLECGFLSNHEENSLLMSDDYQNKIAMAIVTGYLSSYGGTNESQNSLLLY